MFQKELIVLPQQIFADKAEVISYLTHLDNDRVTDKNLYEKDVKERESVIPTYVGYGIGLPHARTEAVEDAFRYGRIVLATTTYNADIFPFMREFINHLTERGFKNKTIGMIENGSWAPMAIKTMKSMLEGCKDITYTENNVKITSALNDTSKEQIEKLKEEVTYNNVV